MFLPCLLILVLWVQLPHWLYTQGNALLHCPHSRSSLIELQTEAWKGFPVSCVRSSKQSCYPGNNLVFKTTSHILKELYFLLWSIQEWKLWPPRRRGSVRTRVDPYKSFFFFLNLDWVKVHAPLCVGVLLCHTSSYFLETMSLIQRGTRLELCFWHGQFTPHAVQQAILPTEPCPQTTFIESPFIFYTL